MRTDDLIDLLSTNLEPVNRWEASRALTTALAAGAAAVLCVMLLVFGVRPDFTGTTGILLLKLVFTLGVVVLAAWYLAKLVRPGGERKVPLALASLPFLAIMLLAGVNLAFAPSSHWDMMMADDQWLECLVSIPVIAIVPFASVIWAVRKGAPTDLTRAGALSGLLAGGLSATGYALHCTADALPFVALWYGGTIALCTFAGAKLGPRLLRW